MTRPLPDEVARIRAIHHELGIPEDYGARTGLQLHPDAQELEFAGDDVFGRPQRMTPRTLTQWQSMFARAQRQNITLLLISAFRSVRYQHELIARKLAAGQDIVHILTVNAAPGYSEHHTGCALDLTTTDCASLDIGFETTQAFAWLGQHAGEFGFRLSYPRSNPHGITYEPWHWMCLDG